MTKKGMSFILIKSSKLLQEIDKELYRALVDVSK